LYVPDIIVFRIEIDNLESYYMTGREVSTTVDSSVGSFTDDFEFLHVS
jgi:hypothetical protein